MSSHSVSVSPSIGTYEVTRDRVLVLSPARQAYGLLRFGFAVLPIVAGLDKYFHALVNWDKYLAPAVESVVNVSAHQLMLVVGAIEVVVGIGVALKPSVFAYLLTFWLWGIVANLMLIPGYYDVALRDFGLSLGALALARLSRAVHT